MVKKVKLMDQLTRAVDGIQVTPKIAKFMRRDNSETEDRVVTTCLRFGRFIALYNKVKVYHIPTGMLAGKPFKTNQEAVEYARIISTFKGWEEDDISKLESDLKSSCNAARLYVTGCRMVDSYVEHLLERVNHAGNK